MAPDTCPNCGADVPPKARACPECGACEETGWSEEASTSDAGIPDDSFNYDDFVKREFGTRKILPYGMRWFWWIVALIAIGLLLGFLFR